MRVGQFEFFSSNPANSGLTPISTSFRLLAHIGIDSANINYKILLIGIGDAAEQQVAVILNNDPA